MVVVVVMVAACVVLVGISYVMLDILTSMMVVPKTPVREVESAGEFYLAVGGGKAIAMEVSGDGDMLAFLEEPSEGGKARLRLFDLTKRESAVYEGEIGGRSVAWLGFSRRLVYEDGGDIFLLDATSFESRRLTSGPEIDYDPLPSPDGRYVLWTRSEGGGQQGGAVRMWVMASEGGEPMPLAPKGELAAWDLAGGRVISMGKGYGAEESGGTECYLQVAAVGRQGWEYLASCESEPRFLWWPSPEEALYVAPWRVSDQASTRAVWFGVSGTGSTRKAASSVALGDDVASYRFYPARREALVAYVGEKGLEYMDYGAGRIYRYTRLAAAGPLAWDEAGGWIYYCGEDGVYRVPLREG